MEDIMMIKRLIAVLILTAMLFSAFGCDAIKQVGGHVTPEEPDNSDTQPGEVQQTKYIYSVLSKSIHLEGCYHIDEIKEDYKNETVGDVSPLLEKGYTLCKDCFPPQIEEDPEEDEEPGVSREDATFLINKNSKKLHKLDCYHIKEMKEANTKYTDLTLEELLEDEHIPCASCMPDEWEIYKENHPELFPDE
jgi:hypothetical protein